MNHKANSNQWPRGAIVIHDVDSKEPLSLMKIVGYTRDDLAKCQYVSKKKPRKIYVNEFRYLLDPVWFGINTDWGNYSQESLERTQLEWERVKTWNFVYAVGQRILTTSADGGFEDITTRKAYIDGGGCAWVWLADNGSWLLQHVDAIT